MGKRASIIAALGVLTVALPAHAQTPPPPRQQPPAPADNGVTVTAERPGVTTTIESRAYALDRDLSAATGTLAEALRNVPSVSVDTEGNVSLRGDPSVEIYVDGKPSPLFAGVARGQAMLSFSAKDIDRVEVMTTPSAAFTPEGSGGIINLVMKAQTRATTTASVSAQYGGAGGTRFSGNYSRKAGKWTITGTANRNNDAVTQTRELRRSATPTPTATPFDTAGDFRQSFENTSTIGNLNLAYDATPKLQLTATVSGSAIDSILSEPASQTYRASSGGVPVNAYDSALVGGVTFHTMGYGAGLTRKFDGQEHDFSATYNASRNVQFYLFDYDVSQFVPSVLRRAEESYVHAVNRQQFVRTNYRRPLRDNAKLRVGYELQLDDNDYDNYFARGPSLSALALNTVNDYDFQQSVNSVFGTYERPWGALNAQFGLRVEAVDMTIASAVDRSYTHLYPTLNFGYKLDDSNNLRGGYSRRVQRAQVTQLNPFVIKFDELNLISGNPDLQPQETDSFEFGYQYRKGQTSYLATLYWRIAHDEFVFVQRDIGGGATLTRPENLGQSQSAGVEFVANGRLTSTLRYTLNATPYWREIDAGNIGFSGKRSGFGIGGNTSLTWDATAKDALQINAMATGKRLNPQGYFAPFWSLNMGWRHKFNDRIAATFTARDVLDTITYKDVINTPTLRSVSNVKIGTNRAAFLQLTYTFGASRPSEPAFDYGGGAAQ